MSDDDIPPTKRIRYVFTLVMPPVDLPDDPVSQKTWLNDTIKKLESVSQPPPRIGVTAVIDE